jgi:MFS family permease
LTSSSSTPTGSNGILPRLLARLLELDRPVPQRDPAEIRAEADRNYRWNFTVNLLEAAAFLPGAAFISSAAVLPLFVSKLTPSPLALGLLAMIAQSAWFLPQLFTANATERLDRKKPVVVNLGFFLERLPIWLMPFAALLAVTAPMVSLALVMAAYAWHGLGAGAVGPAWQDMIARCFPVERRGRFFGTAMFAGTAAGAVASLGSAWLLKSYAFPLNFALSFGCAAVLITVSWIFISLTREPVQPGRAVRQSTRQHLSGLPALLRADPNFRRFLTARSLMALGGMGYGFLTVAAVDRWQIADSAAGLFTGGYLVGETCGNLAFGMLADRRGHKRSLELGMLAAVLGYALAVLAPAPGWYFVVFVLLGVVQAAVVVPGILVVMEFALQDRRPTYVGIANTGVGLVSIVAPLIGAALAELGYGWLFGVAALINLAALLLFHWWVRDPRHLRRVSHEA